MFKDKAMINPASRDREDKNVEEASRETLISDEGNGQQRPQADREERREEN